MFGIIILAIICLPFIWWYLVVMQKNKPLKDIPGPPPLPIIGNAHLLGNSPQGFLKSICKLVQLHGNIWTLYLANEVRVVISDANMAEKVLSSTVHITKSNAYDMFEAWLGTGLLMSTGKKWKTRRRMITPTFHFKILDNFIEVFNSCGNILVQKLSQEVGKKSVDIYPFFNLYSLDVICETSMGIKVAAQSGQSVDYVDAVRGYLHIFIVRVFSVWRRNKHLFAFSNMYSYYKQYLKTLHNFSNNVIDQRREEKMNSKSESPISEEGIKPKTALLDMLLESEESYNLSKEDIREEIDTFMFEGHDTTTSGIAFAVYLLAENPDVQEKVYDEIMSVVGNETDNVTMQHLQDMKYLEMVIKEAQRLYPSVPGIERLVEQDSVIGDLHIPKGTFLTIFIYGLHRNETLFPNPEKFDPERFLPENQAKRHNYSYVPFSAGPRNCIGQKFAMLAMKSTLIKIVKTFILRGVPGFKIDLGMAAILKSFNGVCIQLEHRDRTQH